MPDAPDQRYPAIGDYAYISDCHSAALISRQGSVDWCCMPRLDAPSCFGRMLGWDVGGFCSICPDAPQDAWTVERRYLDDTMVLETRFSGPGGTVRLMDCFAMRPGGRHVPRKQILRVLEGVEGSLDMRIHIAARFDYGGIRPLTRSLGPGFFTLVGGADGLLITGPRELDHEGRHDLAARFTVRAGQRVRLTLTHRLPHELEDGLSPDKAEEVDSRLEETIEWWRHWTSHGRKHCPHVREAVRSAIVLKALTYAPTGAIAAAATTSLPESMGGDRNWDYRFSWIRDSIFTLRALWELGYTHEAEHFRGFIERSAAGSADELQVLFGVGGERRLNERTIPELEGWRGRGPVRVGNAAYLQVQHDMCGELLDLAWRWHLKGRPPDEDYWRFLQEVVDKAARSWRDPDRGIWEMRGDERHFVQSKVSLWSALDRGVKLAETLDLGADQQAWREAREAVRREVEEKGYDSARGVFIQAYGRDEMDASLLLLPVTGFLAWDDPRMVRTADAVMAELDEGGLIRRYRPQGDNLEGREGTFLACTFWLVECLARQGRVALARDYFERAAAVGNDLGLFAEEYDPVAGEMLGNFPQGLTHLSLITADLALDEAGNGDASASDAGTAAPA